MVTNGRMVAWASQALFFKHIPMAQNTLADSLANAALDSGSTSCCRVVPLIAGDKLALFTDGACRGNPGRCSIGVAIVLYRPNASALTVAVVAKATGHGTNTIAKFEAGVLVLHIIKEWLHFTFLNSHCMNNPSQGMISSISRISSIIRDFDVHGLA